MAEINKPAARTFWRIPFPEGEHSGYTDPDQITTSGHSIPTQNTNPDSVYPVLPDSGLLTQGEVYSYQGLMVEVRQTHERTQFPPAQTPDLFTFVRQPSDLNEWMAGEFVKKDEIRVHNSISYKCQQSHQTQEGWEPNLTPALWQVYNSGGAIPVWVQPTGAHDAYQTGEKVHFPTANDPIYESLIDNNVWSPLAYPAGWILD